MYRPGMLRQQMDRRALVAVLVGIGVDEAGTESGYSNEVAVTPQP